MSKLTTEGILCCIKVDGEKGQYVSIDLRTFIIHRTNTPYSVMTSMVLHSHLCRSMTSIESM